MNDHENGRESLIIANLGGNLSTSILSIKDYIGPKGIACVDLSSEETGMRKLDIIVAGLNDEGKKSSDPGKKFNEVTNRMSELLGKDNLGLFTHIDFEEIDDLNPPRVAPHSAATIQTLGFKINIEDRFTIIAGLILLDDEQLTSRVTKYLNNRGDASRYFDLSDLR